MSTDELRKIFIFSSFNDENLKKLQSMSQIRRHTKDSVLFYEGEKASKLYVLIEGVTSVVKTDAKGNEILLHRFMPTSLIAEMATFREINFPATAKFASDGAVLEIDYKPFKETFISDPVLLFEITKSLCTKIKFLEDTITNQLTLDSTARVAKFLYENEKILHSLKHTQMASMLNITPETFSRIVKKFKSKGILSDTGKNFDLLDRDALSRLF